MTQSTEEKSATARLIQRMLSFDGRDFDGYPSMFCLDECLIVDAADESRAVGGDGNPITLMAFLASEHAQSKEQVRNAIVYIDEYVQCSLSCNFHESGRETAEWYDEINDEWEGH